MHWDIKSENLLIHLDPTGNEIFKIADFGFSKSLKNSNVLMNSVLGLIIYHLLIYIYIYIKDGKII